MQPCPSLRPMFRDDEYVALSALQHYIFCPRQCALIHTEQQWAENALTTLGKLEHERVDTAPGTTRGHIRTARAVRLVSHELGIRGISDVVEYETSENGTLRITPIEYKHGREKQHLADTVQLCAQALCLEEMHGIPIPSAAIFYHATRRRYNVELTEELRNETRITITATRRLLQEKQVPRGIRRKECDACSLFNICLPTKAAQPVKEYNTRTFNAILCSTDETTP